MKSQIKSALAHAALLLFVAGLAAGAGLPGVQSDKGSDEVRAAVEKRLRSHKILVDNNVQVQVSDNTITLTGSVLTLTQKDQAIRDAKAVKSKYRLVDNLQVKKSDLTPDQMAETLMGLIEKSSYYTIFDYVEAEAQPDGTVVLSGWADSPSHVSEFEKLAENVPGVTQIRSRLSVIFPEDPDRILRDRAAQIIYTQPTLMSFRQQRGPIHILAQNGTITLVGTVGSPGEKESIGMLIRNNTGALAVDNELEVIEKK